MRDNVFAKDFVLPLATSEEWVPLWADNANSAPGEDVPSLSERRRVHVATRFFHVEIRAQRPVIEAPIASDGFDPMPRVPLAPRAKDWFLSDPG